MIVSFLGILLSQVSAAASLLQCCKQRRHWPAMEAVAHAFYDTKQPQQAASGVQTDSKSEILSQGTVKGYDFNESMKNGVRFSLLA